MECTILKSETTPVRYGVHLVTSFFNHGDPANLRLARTLGFLDQLLRDSRGNFVVLSHTLCQPIGIELPTRHGHVNLYSIPTSFAKHMVASDCDGLCVFDHLI